MDIGGLEEEDQVVRESEEGDKVRNGGETAKCKGHLRSSVESQCNGSFLTYHI